LAQNWTTSADGSQYTFNLRHNVTFSNGDPFNSYQVWLQMYAFYYLSGNGTSWLESYNVFDMSNVTFGANTIALINQSGLANPSPAVKSIMENSSWPIYVIDPNQIVFRLHAPFLYFPGTLVALDGLIFDSQFVLEHGGFGSATGVNTYFSQYPILGTGPYVVTQVSQNAYVRFTQNPTYWGKSLNQSVILQTPIFDPGHAKNVVVYYKPDDFARYSDLATGAVQISAVLNGNWNLVQANPNKYSYETLPSWGPLVSALALNTQVFPTNNTDFRLAIAHAINNTDIAQKAFFGKIDPYVGPEYPAWKQYYDLGNFSPYNYNLTLAKSYLNKSGIQNIPTITFAIPSGIAYDSVIAQIVQADLAQIGITVNVEIQEGNAYWGNYVDYHTEASNPQQIAQLSMMGGEAWAPNTLTPADYWVTFVSNGSAYGNWAIYSNPSVQACVNSFTSNSNVSQIESLCTSAQAQVYSDAPYIWFGVNRLWYGGGSLVWLKGVVTGLYLDPLWGGQDTTPIFNTVTFGTGH
jgi:peptide/nickel transport system substrate-binding protein